MLAELLETERIYVAEMGAILKVSFHLNFHRFEAGTLVMGKYFVSDFLEGVLCIFITIRSGGNGKLCTKHGFN